MCKSFRPVVHKPQLAEGFYVAYKYIDCTNALGVYFGCNNLTPILCPKRLLKDLPEKK